VARETNSLTNSKTLPILRSIAALTVLTLVLTTTVSAAPLSSQHLRGGQPVELSAVGLEQALSRKPSILVTAAVAAVFGAGFVAGYYYHDAQEPRVVHVTVRTRPAPTSVDRSSVAPPATPTPGGLEETTLHWERLDVNAAVFRLQDAVEKAQRDGRPLRAVFGDIGVDDAKTLVIGELRAHVLAVAKSNPTGAARPVFYRQRGDTVWISHELDPTQAIVIAMWSNWDVRDLMAESLGNSLRAHGINPDRQLFLVSDIRGAQAMIEQYHDRLALVMTNEANVHETVDTVRRTSPSASVILMERYTPPNEVVQKWPLRDLADGFGYPYEWPTSVAPVLQREFFARLAPAGGLEERPTAEQVAAATEQLSALFVEVTHYQEVQVLSRQTVKWFPLLTGLLRIPEIEGRVLVEPEAGPEALIEQLRRASIRNIRYYGTIKESDRLTSLAPGSGLHILEAPVDSGFRGDLAAFVINMLLRYLGVPRSAISQIELKQNLKQFRDDLAILAAA